MSDVEVRWLAGAVYLIIQIGLLFYLAYWWRIKSKRFEKELMQ